MFLHRWLKRSTRGVLFSSDASLPTLDIKKVNRHAFDLGFVRPVHLRSNALTIQKPTPS